MKRILRLVSLLLLVGVMSLENAAPVLATDYTIYIYGRFTHYYAPGQYWDEPSGSANFYGICKSPTVLFYSTSWISGNDRVYKVLVPMRCGIQQPYEYIWPFFVYENAYHDPGYVAYTQPTCKHNGGIFDMEYMSPPLTYAWISGCF